MSQIKDIYVYHHSHLDIGFTHTQPVVWELQNVFLDQAIQLCEQTQSEPADRRFYWTCEVTEPVLKWLEQASDRQIERLIAFVRNGQICISALQMHMTPLANAEQMSRVLYGAQILRDRLGARIHTAISHDVNGHPWSLADHLIDAGIELYTTGINIHFGGIPLRRPGLFRWQTQDGRELLTYHGEHYSLFTQFCKLEKKDTTWMKAGLDRYINRIVEEGWPHDFIYLSSTNLPMYDNSPPDSELLEMIERWNIEGHPQRIHLVTPSLFLERLRQIPEHLIPVYRGDWTDYWNFGSASTAYETKVNRRSKSSMKAADLLASVNGFGTKRLHAEAWRQINYFDEHTWGANTSITQPDSPYTQASWMHKAHMAYQGNSLSGFLLHEQMEKLSGNPAQSGEPEGVLLLNASHVEQTVDVRVAEQYLIKGRNTLQGRFVHHEMNGDTDWTKPAYGEITLPPFSYQMLPLGGLQETSHPERIAVADGEIRTPYYKCQYDPRTGRILSLLDMTNNRDIIDRSSDWSLFQFVHESIDPLWQEQKRSVLFDRVPDKCNNNVSCWNHAWKARRRGPEKLLSHEVITHASGVTLVFCWEAPSVQNLEQRITFFAKNPDIECVASFYKNDIIEPESIYFVFPLHLQQGWQATFDTAGAYVNLDSDQLPGVCRDWVSVDQTVSMYDGTHGVTLVCPDAPMVQIGDFHFGKEQAEVPRNENPVLLAWPMNNYWDTNFRARQPGRHTFKYMLTAFSKFDLAAVSKQAARASMPVQTFPVIHCQEKKAGQFLQVRGEIIPYYLKASEEGRAMIVRLHNIHDEEQAVDLIWPDRTISRAHRIDPMEAILEEIAVVNGQVQVIVPAKAWLSLRLAH